MPTINTTSTADISFMLLIFFLVTSSMDSDKVLRRQMPPVPTEELAPQEIDRSKVLTITIGDGDSLAIDQQAVSLAQVGQLVERFVPRAGHDAHVLKLDVSPNSSYDTYFQVQDAIAQAYDHLRDLRARQQYRKPFAQCSAAERQAVARYYPQRIAEGGQQ